MQEPGALLPIPGATGVVKGLEGLRMLILRKQLVSRPWLFCTKDEAFHEFSVNIEFTTIDCTRNREELEA